MTSIQPEGFKELTEALERHRAGTPLRKVHVYSPQGSSVGSPEEVEEVTENGLGSRDGASLFSPSNTSTLTLPQPTHDVPENLIGEDEDAGLPGTKDLRRFSLKKAEDVVQAHLHRKPGFLRPKLNVLPRVPEQRQQRVSERGEASDADVESGPEAAAYQGRGILSTLLNLYQHPDENVSSASSMVSSRALSFERPWNRIWNRSESSDFLRSIPRGEGRSPSEEPGECGLQRRFCLFVKISHLVSSSNEWTPPPTYTSCESQEIWTYIQTINGEEWRRCLRPTHSQHWQSRWYCCTAFESTSAQRQAAGL